MRTFSVAAWLVAVVIVAAAFALLAASAPASCNDADAARTAGLYVQSANGYISVLDKEPGSACAASGMESLCAQANSLISKQPREANAIFTAMFSHEPEASRPLHKPYEACAEVGEKETATAPAARSTTGGGSATSGTPTTTRTYTSSTSSTTATTTITKTTASAHGTGTGTTNVTVTINMTVAAGRRGSKGDPGSPGRNGRNGRNGTTEVIVCPTIKNCGAG